MIWKMPGLWRKCHIVNSVKQHLQGLISTKKLRFHWEWFLYPCRAYTESAIYATQWVWGNHLSPHISFRKFRSVWKTYAVSMRKVSCAQVCQKHFGETIFQIWFGFTKWELFENTCRVYNESGSYSSLWNTVRKPSLSNIFGQVRSLWKLVRSLFGRNQVIYSVIQHWVWKTSFNSNLVSLTYKYLKTNRKNAILNSVKQYSSETIFQLTSCSLKLEVFEFFFGELWGKWHILDTEKL